jgi:hypothetical protein
VAAGEAVDVTGLPTPLASGGYHLGMDPARLPADPAGGTWAFTSLMCDGDDQPAPIDPKTGLAAFSLADGHTRTCVVTVTWTPAVGPAAAAWPPRRIPAVRGHDDLGAAGHRRHEHHHRS